LGWIASFIGCHHWSEGYTKNVVSLVAVHSSELYTAMLRESGAAAEQIDPLIGEGIMANLTPLPEILD